MGRIGWKGGRFSVDYETSEIYRGLRDWQRWTGDYVEYYRFQVDNSTQDSVYGEAQPPYGKEYFGPITLPALHVIHVEGDNQNTDQGFYTNDSAHVTFSFDQIKKLGMDKMDLNNQNYLKDRLVYDTKVFRVTSMQILGQIQRKDIIVALDATQVKPDEMVNDYMFAQYVTPNDNQFSQRLSLTDALYDAYNNGHGIFPLGPDTTVAGALNRQRMQVIPTLVNPSLRVPLDLGYGEGFYNEAGYGGGPVTS